jgi:hypothetical protein
MFKLFSDIYFIVYKLYYVGQNDNLDIRVSLKKWDRGSSEGATFSATSERIYAFVFRSMHDGHEVYLRPVLNNWSIQALWIDSHELAPDLMIKFSLQFSYMAVTRTIARCCNRKGFCFSELLFLCISSLILDESWKSFMLTQIIPRSCPL